MAITAGQAVIRSFQQTRHALFKPFKLKKWLVLTLIAWLMGAYSGGFNFNLNLPLGGGSGEGNEACGEIREIIRTAGNFLITFWQEHTFIIVAIAVTFFLTVLALMLLWTWLQSVLAFVFIDVLVHRDRSALGSFAKNQGKGFSYFLWKVFFGLAVIGIILLFTGMPVVFLLRAGFEGTLIYKIGIIACIVFVMLIISIIALIIQCIAYDFVIPVMLIKDLRIISAWKEFLPVLRKNKGNFTLYILLKIVLRLGAVIIVGIVSFFLFVVFLGSIFSPAMYLWLIGLFLNPLTIVSTIVFAPLILLCCVYAFQCFLLPVPVFFRNYSLVFLGGTDERFAIFRIA